MSNVYFTIMSKLDYREVFRAGKIPLRRGIRRWANIEGAHKRASVEIALQPYAHRRHQIALDQPAIRMGERADQMAELRALRGQIPVENFPSVDLLTVFDAAKERLGFQRTIEGWTVQIEVLPPGSRREMFLKTALKEDLVRALADYSVDGPNLLVRALLNPHDPENRDLRVLADLLRDERNRWFSEGFLRKLGHSEREVLRKAA